MSQLTDYEFWISNDAGVSRTLLNPYKGMGIIFFDYIRSTGGLGYLHFGMPLDDWNLLWVPGFQPDQQIQVLRSPGVPGYDKIEEGTFFLRKHRIYTRDSDSMRIIEVWCHSPLTLLNRRYIIQPSDTGYTSKNDNIDDMMKDIVREQMLFGYAVDQDGTVDTDRMYPQGEFSVEDEHSLGPVVERKFTDVNVLDTLKELRSLSFQLNLEDPTNRKIYFDVVSGSTLNWNEIYILEEAEAFSPILDENDDPFLDERSLDSSPEKPSQFIFRTYADLRGQDRTNGVVFSVENGNMTITSHTIDHIDEVNTVVVRGTGRGDNRLTAVTQDTDAASASRWNRIEATQNGSNQTDEDALLELGRSKLWDTRKVDLLDVAFMDSPGNPVQPRSLYRVDWDLGDLLPVNYVGVNYETEVQIIYISMSEDGQESISGRNIIE